MRAGTHGLTRMMFGQHNQFSIKHVTSNTGIPVHRHAHLAINDYWTQKELRVSRIRAHNAQAKKLRRKHRSVSTSNTCSRAAHCSGRRRQKMQGQNLHNTSSIPLFGEDQLASTGQLVFAQDETWSPDDLYRSVFEQSPTPQ